MIDPRSLVGYGALALLLSILSSALLGLLLAALGPALRRRGPQLERSAAAAVLWAPPVVGLIGSGLLAAQSHLAFVRGLDHCAAHTHHLHLCLHHGEPWLSQAWALALLASALVYVGVRGLRELAHLWQTRRRLAVLEGSSRSSLVEGVAVCEVESDELFCFTAGLWQPRVYLSTAAMRALDDETKAVVMAHERCHVARRDVLRRAALRFFALAGAPIFAARALTLWERATERSCDRAALAAGRDSARVAEVLIDVVRRFKRAGPQPSLGFADVAALDDRVDALLGELPDGGAAARRWSRLLLIPLAVLLLSAGLFADELHHLVETLFGSL